MQSDAAYRSHNAFSRNAAGYELVFRLENVLRSFVTERFERRSGPRWTKQRVPGDVKEKIKTSLHFERSFRWHEFIPHPPLCYVDFGDLSKIIAQGNNWADEFESVFAPKDLFLANMREVELIRNKIAHSRLITEAELSVLANSEGKLRSCVGSDAYDRLLQSIHARRDIPGDLKTLSAFLGGAVLRIAAVEVIVIPEEIRAIQNAWWLDADFLGGEAENIRICLTALECYVKIPRLRGEGYKLEEWIKSSDLVAKIKRATEAVAALTKA